MSRIARRQVIDPVAMSDEERARFGEALSNLNARVFSGVSKDDFLGYAFNPNAARIRILIFEDSVGKIVGYIATQFFRQAVGGITYPVFRAEAGILPGYRGRHATVSFGLWEAALYKLRHPLQQVFYLGMLVHPSSYHLLAKHFPLIYPSRNREIPRQILAFMAELADAFGTARVDDDPLRRQVGWITREPPEEPGHSPEALANAWFFAEMNPGYEQGHGLVTLVPLNFSNLLVGIWRFLLTRVAGS
jgi:hypothetical protein